MVLSYTWQRGLREDEDSEGVRDEDSARTGAKDTKTKWMPAKDLGDADKEGTTSEMAHDGDGDEGGGNIDEAPWVDQASGTSPRLVNCWRKDAMQRSGQLLHRSKAAMDALLSQPPSSACL